MHADRRDFLKMLAAAGLACGTKSARAAGDAAPAEVHFWDMRNGPTALFGPAGRGLATRYSTANPGVKVSYETEEWSEWPQLFYLAMSMGQAPDLSTGGSYQAIQFYDKGEILELDDLVAELKQAGEDKDFLPGALDYMLYKGHTIALPTGIDLRVMYYRKDLFAKAGIDAPRTWDELRSAARSLTTGGQYGFAASSEGYRGMHLLFTLILNNGGGIFTSDGEVDLMSDRNIETFEFLANLVKDGLTIPGIAKFTNEEAQAAFLGGGATILFDAPGLAKQYPNQTDKIGLLSPLAGPHGDKGTIYWVNNTMLYKQSKCPAQAKAFLKWWSANQTAMWTEGQCNRLPVRLSIAADPYFQSDPITKKILDEWVPVGKSVGTHKKEVFPALNDLEGYGALTVLCQDLLTGKDVRESASLAQTRLKTLLDPKHRGAA